MTVPASRPVGRPRHRAAQRPVHLDRRVVPLEAPEVVEHGTEVLRLDDRPYSARRRPRGPPARPVSSLAVRTPTARPPWTITRATALPHPAGPHGPQPATRARSGPRAADGHGVAGALPEHGDQPAEHRRAARVGTRSVCSAFRRAAGAALPLNSPRPSAHRHHRRPGDPQRVGAAERAAAGGRRDGRERLNKAARYPGVSAQLRATPPRVAVAGRERVERLGGHLEPGRRPPPAVSEGMRQYRGAWPTAAPGARSSTPSQATRRRADRTS